MNSQGVMNVKDRYKSLFLLWILGMPVTVQAADSVLVIDQYPINKPVFTQGLEVIENRLVLGTGLYGESEIGWIDLETGDFQVQDQLDDDYFGEGLTATSDYLWQFTWREEKAYKRSLDDLTLLEEITFDGDGWGMAYDEKADVIWTSDGSAQLTKRDPETLVALDTLTVTQNNQMIERLNELEYANEAIYANVWQTNKIVKINLQDGQVEQVWDLTDLVEELHVTDANPDRVLNGIAHIEGNRFYVTGKLFPIIWEVELN